MGRAEGFRLQAGFGVHLHRGCLATSSGGAWPRAAAVSVHNSHNLKPLPRGAWPQAAQPQPFCGNFSFLTWTIICIRSLMVRLVPQSHTRACTHCPTCAPVPRQVAPQSHTRACTHCPTCAQFPTETPTPRPVPPPTSHPYPDPSPSSDSSRLCPCRYPRRGRPRPRTQNSRACAKRSSTGSKRTNANCPCAHREHRLGAPWSAKS